MAISIKSIFAVTLLTFTMTATAGTVTVHNQGHYLVSFKVWGQGQDSGVFPIGQSRTMVNVSGGLELKMLRLFTWSIFDSFTSPFPALYDVNDDSNIEVTFMGDIFNPRIIINGNVLFGFAG